MKGAGKLKMGDPVEVVLHSYLSTSYPGHWTPAAYYRKLSNLRGHHWVKLESKVWVAHANVIDEDSVSIYGGEAKQTDMIIVPSRRIRRRKP